MRTVVHITHEATHKIGGIGTVLEGLLCSRVYQQEIGRSILVGTWELGTSPSDRLGDSGAQVLYSVCDGIDEGEWRRTFRPIEEAYQVWITYGTRTLQNGGEGTRATVETLLIEAAEMNAARLNYLKATFYQRFGVPSANYENESDYDHWLRIAEPAYEAVMTLLAATGRREDEDPLFFVSHEYMGMPTALKAILEHEPNVYTIFYAHEVATIRPQVENHPGHDTRFYNLMEQARAQNLYVDDVLGDQWGSYRHALIDRAQFCDDIFAVGDKVLQEYRFLSPACAAARADLVYNGIPASEITYEDKIVAKGKLVRYAEALLGFHPDYIFTHVTRLVLSKGLWRDIRVLEHLDRSLARAGKSAVMFVLSTEIARGRPADVVRQMEAEYGWPVFHREGYPDLVGQEIGFHASVATFNARSRAVKVVFVNQFGWTQERCGDRMPADMSFLDIRVGTDVEFGQSIYEPFGIAQVEPLSFGAICVMTNVCGCVGFIRKATDDADVPNVIVADYTTLGGGYMGVEAVAQIGWAERDAIERRNSVHVAEALFERLSTERAHVESMIRRGYQIARNMSWDVVVRDYFLPGLERAQKPKQT